MAFNKKAMLGNIIGTFIVILVGVSLIPMIAQEVDNAANCALYNYENISNATGTPKGPTESFGGAGADYHFGGYDGKVEHKSFLSDYAVVKTNSSILNSDCKPITGPMKTALNFVPIVFGLAIALAGIGMAYSSLRNMGQV